MKPSEYVKEHSNGETKMKDYNINGCIIKTNFGAFCYPYWNGNGNGYHKLNKEGITIGALER